MKRKKLKDKDSKCKMKQTHLERTTWAQVESLELGCRGCSETSCWCKEVTEGFVCPKDPRGHVVKGLLVPGMFSHDKLVLIGPN